MIDTVQNPLRSEAVHLPSTDDIAKLARFRSRKADALSFFYGRQTCIDVSHRCERLTIENLIRDECIRTENTGDIGPLLRAVEGIKYNSSVWRASYTSISENFEEQFSIPVPLSSAEAKVGAFLFLAPLLRAIQSSRPYDVLLVERGRSRLFVVSGTQVEEDEPLTNDVRFQRRSEDNRVGWSKHIQHNLEHATQAWFLSVSNALGCRYSIANSGRLVLACRADVLGEIQPVMTPIASRIIGWTPLPGLQITPTEVFLLARPIFERYDLLRCQSVLESVKTDMLPVLTGVSHVLRALESGRVRTLLIGSLSDEHAFGCTACQAMLATSRSTCDACGSTDLVKFPAEEACIRSALAHNAEILVYPQSEMNHFEGIAASLRY